MVEQKNIGLAVSCAKRLNDCFNELSAAIAARPAVKGDKNLWQFDYAALPSALENAERENWNHKCGSNDVALFALRGAVTNGNLQLWTFSSHGEAQIDRYELKELTFRTFASGTYQPNNRRLDSAGLADISLWVKETDWHRYMLDLWQVRYGIDWTNPAPPAHMPIMLPEGQFVTLSHALSWLSFGVSMDKNCLHEVLNQDRYGEHDPQKSIAGALEKLLSSAGNERISIRAKYRASRDSNDTHLLTEKMEAIKFDDYRQFSYLEDELRHGAGLLFWHDGSGQVFQDLFGGGRKDSYVQVTVNRADLLREFPRHETAKSVEIEHFSDVERQEWIKAQPMMSADKAHRIYKAEPKFDGTKQDAFRKEWRVIKQTNRGRQKLKS